MARQNESEGRVSNIALIISDEPSATFSEPEKYYIKSLFSSLNPNKTFAVNTYTLNAAGNR
jgi:hypothetical protein